MSHDNQRNSTAYAISIDQPAPSITVVVPRPALVNDRNAETVIGLSIRAWRKTARAMQLDGSRVVETADGMTAALDDVLAWIATDAPSYEPRQREKPERPETAAQEAARALAAGGGRRGSK